MHSSSPPQTNSKQARYEELIKSAQAMINGRTTQLARLANLTALIKTYFDHHWIGFYLAHPATDVLVLGPFQGPPACEQIQFGKGVCGKAALWQRTLVVPDVEQFDGHIACSTLSRSEIVVPLVQNARTALVLDIDSTELNMFDWVDQFYLEQLVSLLYGISNFAGYGMC